MPRRIAAGLIDVALVLAVGGLGALAGSASGRLTAAFKRASRWTSTAEGQSRLGWLSSRPGKAVHSACVIAATALTRNVRLPGARLLGLRRVELATGGPLTVKQALVHHLAGWLQQQCLYRPVAPIMRREMAKLATIQSQLADHQHADERAHRQAFEQLYREYDVKSWRSCAPGAAVVVIGQLPVLLSRRHQSLPDLLAGVVVVEVTPGTPSA